MKKTEVTIDNALSFYIDTTPSNKADILYIALLSAIDTQSKDLYGLIRNEAFKFCHPKAVVKP